jgi:hypothetical protein
MSFKNFLTKVIATVVKATNRYCLLFQSCSEECARYYHENYMGSERSIDKDRQRLLLGLRLIKHQDDLATNKFNLFKQIYLSGLYLHNIFPIDSAFLTNV